MMKRILERIVEDIPRGENIDLMVTIVLAVVIAILDVLNIAPYNLVSSITLSVLGLIAISLLITRYRIEEIARAGTRDLVYFSTEKPDSLDSYLQHADEIWLLGVNMSKTTEKYFQCFLEKVRNGGQIRVLISNPTRNNLDEIQARFGRPGTISKDIASRSDMVLRFYSEIKKSVNRQDSIQVRLIDFIPPYSLYVIPHSANGGVVCVEVYGYRSETGKSGSQPKFQVTEHENPHWYQHFVDQFEAMWGNGQVHEL